jgi:hypothetical protein
MIQNESFLVVTTQTKPAGRNGSKGDEVEKMWRFRRVLRIFVVVNSCIYIHTYAYLILYIYETAYACTYLCTNPLIDMYVLIFSHSIYVHTQ